jgi:hypothetical protein
MRLKPQPLFRGIDRVIAGLWWWQFCRARITNYIGRITEGSSQERIAYKTWQRYEFACKFGRTTEQDISDCVEVAVRNKAAPGALALLVANRDVSILNGQLRYRRSPWLKLLGLLARTICLVGSIMFATLLALAPIPLIPKLIAFLVIFALLIAGAYVFELYTNRPLAAAAYLEQMDALSEKPAQANVVSLHEHPAFKTNSNAPQKK